MLGRAPARAQPCCPLLFPYTTAILVSLLSTYVWHTVTLGIRCTSYTVIRDLSSNNMYEAAARAQAVVYITLYYMMLYYYITLYHIISYYITGIS